MFSKSPKLKLAMIPLLASALGLVLMQQNESSSVSPELITRNRGVPVSTKKQTEWPEFELEEIAMLQPFKTSKLIDQVLEEDVPSDAVPETEIDTKSNAVASEAMHVRAIFQTPRGAAALVGDRVVRVGDVLPNGMRVTAIHPDGIEVAKD